MLFEPGEWTQVPLKPNLLATLKSNNYLLNCLVAMTAQDVPPKA